MRTCYVVGAAPFSEEFFPDETDLVIAADGGQAALASRGITPHLVVGDFDSSEAPDSVPFIRHPVMKDDTDTTLAVKEGMRRGYEVFILYGCQGGSPDHAFANVQTLHRIAKEGLHGYLVGNGMVGTVVIDRKMQFAPKGRVSVFSLTDLSEGVCIRGLKYPLENAVLTNDVPLGVSNEGDGSAAEISVKRGVLYVLWEQHES
ncbi:MAG: thiamine diphosphokinase [Clostridia bacterium]|nr:thiamine diphosphokinase [Clostridia bacterium]MBO7169704.1 thiamine diphosphokinase [Clostridia bacterium]